VAIVQFFKLFRNFSQIFKNRKIPKKPGFPSLSGIFHGPSDWSRTSGLLNPIQARYQTAPHPVVHFSMPNDDNINSTGLQGGFLKNVSFF
jgi:hypothetical protein